MHKLIKGVQQFQTSVFSCKQRQFECLADGQQPVALFITCSDSRVHPNLFTQTEPGDLFILRNAGNIVPPYDACLGGEAATVEYAISVLKIPDIVVCGHSHCGAMCALSDLSDLTDLPTVESWLSYSKSLHQIIEKKRGPIVDAKARLTAMIEENVLIQLEHLKTHPSVATALAENSVKLHGWVYEFETGRVFSYDSKKEEFTTL